MRRDTPKMRNLLAIVLATLLAGSLAYGNTQAWAENQGHVTVSHQAWVKGEKVYLKDIASIAGPPRVCERLGTVFLAYAPRPGGHKSLHGSWIAGKVRSKSWLPANVVLNIPEVVTIGRTSQRIHAERVQQSPFEAPARVSQAFGMGYEALAPSDISWRMRCAAASGLSATALFLRVNFVLNS